MLLDMLSPVRQRSQSEQGLATFWSKQQCFCYQSLCACVQNKNDDVRAVKAEAAVLIARNSSCCEAPAVADGMLLVIQQPMDLDDLSMLTGVHN